MVIPPTAGGGEEGQSEMAVMGDTKVGGQQLSALPPSQIALLEHQTAGAPRIRSRRAKVQKTIPQAAYRVQKARMMHECGKTRSS